MVSNRRAKMWMSRHAAPSHQAQWCTRSNKLAKSISLGSTESHRFGFPVPGAAGPAPGSNACSASHKCLFVFFVRPYGYRMRVRNMVTVRDIRAGWLADDADACESWLGHGWGHLDGAGGGGGGLGGG